jgi:hypothetical protein
LAEENNCGEVLIDGLMESFEAKCNGNDRCGINMVEWLKPKDQWPASCSGENMQVFI